MTPKKAEAPGRAEGNDETRPTSNRILAPAADWCDTQLGRDG